jgi:hypothetical protein
MLPFASPRTGLEPGMQDHDKEQQPSPPGTSANMDVLRRMQRAAYVRLGFDPPDFGPEQEAQRDAANAEALKPGGSVESGLTEALIAKGLNPKAAQPLLQDLREAVQQMESRATKLSPLEAGERPLTNPHHLNILNVQRKRIETVISCTRPEMVKALAPVLGHVVVDELPTGELNARAFLAPDSSDEEPTYWVLVDPVFFDFFFHLSNAFASIIDVQALAQVGSRYARGDETALITDVIRWGATGPATALFEMLRTFVVYGTPPVLLTPYDDRSFDLAEAMRDRAALFVVAHEYGHIINGDLRLQASDSAPWRAEIGADLTGWGLTSAVLEMESVPPASRLAGANLFFAGLMLVELTRNALTTGQARTLADLAPDSPKEPTGSHPPSSARFGVLMEKFRKQFPEQQARAADFFAALLLELMSRFWALLEPAFLSMHQKGIRPKPIWKGLDALAQGKL